MSSSRCLVAHVERERAPRALLDGAFAAPYVVGVDVGVCGELVGVVMDDERVSDAGFR